MKELSFILESEVLHEIQLVDTQMISIHCDINRENVKEEFELNITQMGKFVKNEEIDISKEDFEDFLAVQGIRLLWSFARENVYEISCKMLRHPILLPTLDVMKTLKKK